MKIDHSPVWVIWKFVRKFINVSVAPFVPFTVLRIALYRLVGFKIGKNCFIGMRCYLDDAYPEQTTICDNVTISYDCTFACHGIAGEPAPLRIEPLVYVGTGTIFVSRGEGVVIGEGAVIGAGSVVTRSIPPWKIAYGNPARVVRDAPRGTPDDPHPRAAWNDSKPQDDSTSS